MADRNDLVFKKIVNRVYTSPTKDWFEENAGVPFKLNAKDVWLSEIPSTPPEIDTAVVRGYRSGNKLSLTQDISVNSRKSWLAKSGETQLDSFISPRYGQDYTVRLFRNGTTEIPTGTYGWFFDYESGIITFDSDPGAGTYELQVYRYTGETVSDLKTTLGGSAWQDPVKSIVTVPPTSDLNDRYLVDESVSSGVFAGHAKSLAQFDGVSWQFVPATSGMIVYVIDVDRLYVYDNNDEWNWSGIDSADLDYDNSDSGLEAISVKAAIDEIVTKSLVYDEVLGCFMTEAVRTISL